MFEYSDILWIGHSETRHAAAAAVGATFSFIGIRYFQGARSLRELRLKAIKGEENFRILVQLKVVLSTVLAKWIRNLRAEVVEAGRSIFYRSNRFLFLIIACNLRHPAPRLTERGEVMLGMKYLISAAVVVATSLAASAAAHASDALVNAEWVEKNLDNPKVRIFEVSVDTGVYERGHIPGAANLNWHTDLVDRERRDIASREAFEKHLRTAGVGDDTTIVLYGDNNNWFAAWGAWVFETYGLGDRVKLLDGGRKLWEAKGLPLESKPTEHAASNLTIRDRDPSVRARFTDVVAVAEGKHDIKLIDIRSADEYSGKIFAPEGVKELSVRAGHIPGAVNVPWGSIVNTDGTFKPAEEIKALYAAKGVDGAKPIITYCRIGERSSHTWFALKKILGYDVRNYDGSWTEYGNAVGVPVSNPSGTIWTGK